MPSNGWGVSYNPGLGRAPELRLLGRKVSHLAANRDAEAYVGEPRVRNGGSMRH